MKKLIVTLIMILVIMVAFAEKYDFGKISVTKDGSDVTVSYPISKGPMIHKEDAQKNPLGEFTWDQVKANLQNIQPVVWVFEDNIFIDATVNENVIEFTCPIEKIRNKTWNIVFFSEDANYWVHGYKYSRTQFGFNINERGGALTLKEPMK
ncbi:MAG: hypothetical protein PHZ07_05355 [Patescibacteria group bacterium]|nr:hypothetical protein [Patescibacteria group bacterium]MDD4304856.1 hypothetical protein [Patescibacteria group bacterium]MDD4695826.1 hypothetical protein [Patescibacteria group bacterium]